MGWKAWWDFVQGRPEKEEIPPAASLSGGKSSQHNGVSQSCTDFNFVIGGKTFKIKILNYMTFIYKIF